ncbi:phospholipase D-like domain-containing protein [Halorubrum sp. DTA46]|uniref:phospholipase D-like domain-containing protein n=1 Tax=Halorubrum sp. DTA46 TaxID=3402162 RepID=UPI003AAAC254
MRPLNASSTPTAPPSLRFRSTVVNLVGLAVRVAVAVLVVLAVGCLAVPVSAEAASGVESPAAGVGSTAAGAPTPQQTNESVPTNADPRIVELYPNPTTEGNRGEYLVVRLPERGNWSISDGYHETRLPRNASGTVALSMAPESTAALLAETSARDARGPTTVRALDGHFPLAASGDRIELRRDGRAVDAVEYGRVREGYRWRAEWNEWRPRGYEPRAPARTANATVRPFVLPDAPHLPVEPLRDADDRLLLAGYTLESSRVADLLADAVDRGVTVRVLIEGSPVGGFSVRSAELLDRLVAAGVEVRVLDGEPDRFRFHHAKYAVADDRAVVLTENWKASGTGGRSSRGWGLVTEPQAPGNDTPGDSAADPTVTTTADDLAAVFRDDFRAHDARSWESFRADAAFHDSGRANGSYPARFGPPAPTAADVELLTAPGNAADRLVARIDAADERVLAVVPRTGGSDDRIVRALRRAAERGVDVHLLVSGTWYDREANRDLADALAGEPIDVAVAEPRGRYGTLHAKGLVVDDTAIVGSLNWNRVAATENREVLLAVEDASVAAFYARAFAADWRGGGVHLPVGLLGGLGVAVAGGGVLAHREVAFA